MYFLFGIIDKEKRTVEFRDCYPILEKKAESVFRQKCYSWYTGTSISDKKHNILRVRLIGFTVIVDTHNIMHFTL